MNGKEPIEAAKTATTTASGDEQTPQLSTHHMTSYSAVNTPQSQKKSAMWVYQMPTFFPVAVPFSIPVYTLAQMQENVCVSADGGKNRSYSKENLSRQTTAERSPGNSIQTTDEGFDVDSLISDDAIAEGADIYVTPGMTQSSSALVSSVGATREVASPKSQQKVRTRPTKVPCDMLSKTKLCMFYLKGACTKGENCSFAHELYDLKDRPDLLHTRLCLAFQKRGTCKDGDSCRFAHNEAQLRQIEAGRAQLQLLEQVRSKDRARIKMTDRQSGGFPRNEAMSSADVGAMAMAHAQRNGDEAMMEHAQRNGGEVMRAHPQPMDSPPLSPGGSPMFPVKGTFVHFGSLEPKSAPRRPRSCDGRT
jgi:hypothetical protein